MEQEVNESEPISGDSPTEDYSVESLYKRFPNPLQHYKVAVYVKYQLNCLQPDYLRNLKSDYDEMLSRYENWEFVDYYVDTAPQSASLSDLESWIRLVSDCESGKVDLILIANAFAFPRACEKRSRIALFLSQYGLDFYFLLIWKRHIVKTPTRPPIQRPRRNIHITASSPFRY